MVEADTTTLVQLRVWGKNKTGSYLELFSHILFCISSRTCIFCPCFAIRHNKNTLTVSPVMQHHKSATWMQREQRNPLLEQTTLMNWGPIPFLFSESKI